MMASCLLTECHLTHYQLEVQGVLNASCQSKISFNVFFRSLRWCRPNSNEESWICGDKKKYYTHASQSSKLLQCFRLLWVHCDASSEEALTSTNTYITEQQTPAVLQTPLSTLWCIVWRGLDVYKHIHHRAANSCSASDSFEYTVMHRLKRP